MELVDCHTHTRFSDGASTLEENARRAQELGITTLCCTDHLTLPREMDPRCEVSVPEADLEAYGAAVAHARALVPSIDIVYGFECDYYPSCCPNIERWAAGATFLLGSVHMLDGCWIDDLSDLSYWDERGTDAVWERYFEVWCEACAAGFDSMAHPDLVMLLGRFPSEAVAINRLYAQAADAAQAYGVHIEVNTAGYGKPVGRLYPATPLLDAFWRAGVPVTVGSDAHRVERIGDRIADAYKALYQVGYRSVDVPTSAGGWRSFSL